MPSASPYRHAAGSRRAAADQAEGLRRLFGHAPTAVLPLVANPHMTHAGVAVERLCAALALQGRRVLIVDAAAGSPPVPEAAAIGLRLCVEPLTPQISYMAARGLPARHVDTHGSSASLLDALCAAAPQADVVLVHAEATELARLFTGRAARPMLLAADEPESVKHAYAAWKLLALRRGWLSADLLLLAAPNSPRAAAIAISLARCADSFVGGALAAWAHIDPESTPQQVPDANLQRIAATQLELPGGDAPRVSHEGRGEHATHARRHARP